MVTPVAPGIGPADPKPAVEGDQIAESVPSTRDLISDMWQACEQRGLRTVANTYKNPELVGVLNTHHSHWDFVTVDWLDDELKRKKIHKHTIVGGRRGYHLVDDIHPKLKETTNEKTD